jgi:hypothetical protein
MSGDFTHKHKNRIFLRVVGGEGVFARSSAGLNPGSMLRKNIESSAALKTGRYLRKSGGQLATTTTPLATCLRGLR